MSKHTGCWGYSIRDWSAPLDTQCKTGTAPLGTQCKTGKVAFETREAAIEEMKRRRRMDPYTIALRVYKCSYCGMYHFTKKHPHWI